ncbi:hypothetical protein KFZ58_14775 [Virgibacillus sp. NKC19-16]|uniref:hypothetical protein n=1 Tax=Virgibacillus salidurans TaxID=2831673 RepID=UPI001F3406B4|nr:hypothetical protein [Virgibacillus sp. NKC19-16]UJL45643.1 hypothetical protein KFZ58_14775 [Virgibacillus sp. NKC19-16]
MTVNLRKYTAMNTHHPIDNENNPMKTGSDQKPMIGTSFKLFCLSQLTETII